uniref:Uncharacterized protein n=1 Tax=Proteus mirabilis TaxID=584 RepID=A0A411ANF2_PROMI|nr:hypothetical protein 1_SGI1-O_023 [Proteus mirabilis]QAX89140.1 hypothetical protein SGI1-I_022 [Proteus mirabilis]QAX89189.1 hypothetical protein SGI1-PmCA14_022 [Proteus mirabilis]QAX89281.1 hypothetical protein SGI1-PmCA46_022 [Proteus mirabilis]QAX89328.1 hypothetical protein 1_SGI1-B_023 [Proteus mirabilis]
MKANALDLEKCCFGPATVYNSYINQSDSNVKFIRKWLFDGFWVMFSFLKMSCIFRSRFLMLFR